MGQSYFRHLWPQKSHRDFIFSTHTYIASVLNCTDLRHGWAIFGPLVTKNTQEGDLSRTRRHRKVFWAFFHMFWDMNLKSGIHIRQVARHIKFEFHHSQASASGEFFRLFLSVLRYQFESWFIHAVSYCSYCTISQLQWAKDNRIPWDSHCPWSIRGRNIYEWIILIYDKITKKRVRISSDILCIDYMSLGTLNPCPVRTGTFVIPLTTNAGGVTRVNTAMDTWKEG